MAEEQDPLDSFMASLGADAGAATGPDSLDDDDDDDRRARRVPPRALPAVMDPRWIEQVTETRGGGSVSAGRATAATTRVVRARRLRYAEHLLARSDPFFGADAIEQRAPDVFARFRGREREEAARRSVREQEVREQALLAEVAARLEPDDATGRGGGEEKGESRRDGEREGEAVEETGHGESVGKTRANALLSLVAKSVHEASQTRAAEGSSERREAQLSDTLWRAHDRIEARERLARANRSTTRTEDEEEEEEEEEEEDEDDGEEEEEEEEEEEDGRIAESVVRWDQSGLLRAMVGRFVRGEEAHVFDYRDVDDDVRWDDASADDRGWATRALEREREDAWIEGGGGVVDASDEGGGGDGGGRGGEEVEEVVER